jgi:sulfide:quinone oxidoreductase
MKKLEKNILVLGGGFAGIEAAIALGKEEFFNVTLVSDREYMYIYPVSIWIPTNEVAFNDVTLPLDKVAKRRGFNFLKDEVIKIEGNKNRVTLKNSGEKDFDYLIVAVGADKIALKGSENTLSICGNPEEAIDIQKKLDLLIAKGSGKIAMGFGGNPKDSSAVRGGPGFELLFNVSNLLEKKGVRDNFELTFFAPMPKPGARLGENSTEMMNKYFEMKNLKQHYGKKIKEFVKDGVIFEDETKLESDLTMFIPANTGHKNMIESDLPLSDTGFILTNDYSQVEGFENIFAVGDVAKLDGPDWRAKQGHIAEVQGRNAAQNIIIKENNLPFNLKGYKNHLNILCVMDSGDGAVFMYKDNKKAWAVPMPIIGHWLKKGWGLYAKWTKLGYIPRIPGM